MNERLRIDYEAASMQAAGDTILVLLKGGKEKEAKDFALQAIENWRAEEKEGIIKNFSEWLAKKGIVIGE